MVANARQRLVIIHLAPGQAMDGLVVHFDHAGRGQCLEQRAGLAAGHQCLRGTLGVFAIQRDTVAPRLLGGIHGDVGLLGQLVDMVKLIGCAEGDADADADRLDDAKFAETGRVDQALAALRDLLGLGRRGTRQEGGEFIATQAIQAVVGAQCHHQRIGR